MHYVPVCSEAWPLCALKVCRLTESISLIQLPNKQCVPAGTIVLQSRCFLVCWICTKLTKIWEVFIGFVHTNTLNTINCMICSIFLSAISKLAVNCRYSLLHQYNLSCLLRLLKTQGQLSTICFSCRFDSSSWHVYLCVMYTAGVRGWIEAKDTDILVIH